MTIRVGTLAAAIALCVSLSVSASSQTSGPSGQPRGVSPAPSAGPPSLVVEAEDLLRANRIAVHGGRAVLQPMSAFGTGWSNNAQLLWAEGQVGSVLHLAVDVPAPGRYAVELEMTRGPDYGVLKLEVDGKPSPAQFDGFAPQVLVTGPIQAGTFDLDPGPRRISFTIAGKHPQSRGLLAGIDRVKLAPSGSARPTPEARTTPSPAPSSSSTVSPAGPMASAPTINFPALALVQSARLLGFHKGPPLCPLDSSCWSPNDFWLSPSPSAKSVAFRWDITRIPNAQGVMWQVVLDGFPPFSASTALTPPGLLASAVVAGKSGEFTIDVPALFTQRLHASPQAPMAPVPPAMPPEASRATPVPQRGASLGETPGVRFIHVRVVPLRSTAPKEVLGGHSNLIRIHYGTPPQAGSSLKIVQRTTFKEGPPLVITRFEWVRAREIKNWPPGCTPSSEQDKGFLEKFVSSVEDAWDWVSETYHNAKAKVVTGLASAFEFMGVPVPRSVIEMAVDGMLMAAGIPPDIPNLDQLMNEGADYLAGQLVAQIPVPPEVTKGVTGPAAEYAIDQFKQKAKTQAKAQLVSAAQQFHSGSEGTGKTCQGKYAFPYLKLRIRNVGNIKGTDVPFSVTDGNLIFAQLGSTIDEILPGQELTVPVYLFSKDHMNVPNDRKCNVNPRECNLDLWWKKFQYTKFQFTVTAAQKTECTETGVVGHTQVFCRPVMSTLYQTPIQDWSLVYDKGFVAP